MPSPARRINPFSTERRRPSAVGGAWLAAAFAFAAPSVQAASIWIEGEDAAKKSVAHHGWYDSVKKDLLSGKQWLSHYGEKAGEASYAFEAPEAGSYTLWARLNPVASQPKWKLDGGEWKPIDLKDARGQQNVAADGGVDHRFIAWVNLGKTQLAAGKHELAFHWEGGAANSGGLDCFVLTTDAFVPQGTLKPGAAAEGAEAPADPTQAVWIEGENPTKQAMNRHPWWYDQVKKDALSGGDWISNFSKEKEGTADYDFEIVKADDYAFWVRANTGPGAKLSYKLDGGDWTPLPFRDARGQQNVAADDKPDLRFIAWVKAGNVKLAEGKHTVQFKMHSGPDATNHGGLDCFVFTRIPFVPAGSRKPTITAAAGGPGQWFPLLADEDPLSADSVIDMSKLVPAPAGKFGFLQTAGKDLKFEKGAAAVKFWGVGANVEPGNYSREKLAHRAKFLRKFGINVVRQHAVFDELTTDGKIDPRKMDEYDFWFAELKKNGIYTDWSVFYHFTVGPQDGYDPALYAELEGPANRKDTYGIICISPELWEKRNKALTAFLAHKNPYTGLKYVDDPALAVVEMNNEDSIFFWNPLGWLAEGKKAPKHSQILRKKWAAWVKAKYKSDEVLAAAWGKLREGDSVKADELKLMGPWELPGEGPRGPFDGQVRRAGDYIQFLAELQRANFAACETAIRAAGFKGVTVTTAWQVGGAATDPANTWTDAVGGMIDRHNYAGGGDGGHGITEGKVNNESHLRMPGGGIFSVGMKQVEDKPFSITEWTQCPPNQWKVECAPIMAFYAMGLQGWDASFHFAQSGTRLGDGWPRMSSYVTDTPHYLGQFPALAFALHHGHVQEGPIAAARRATVADLFTGKDVFKQDFTKGGFDVKTLSTNGGTPAEAFAIGRTTVGFDGGKSEQVDFAKFWDEGAKSIRSATGELTWDYGRERITIHTPKTQGVVGKTGGSETVPAEVALPGFSGKFKTPFVSVLFTPLDDLPLADSRRILITALAQDRQSGARYNADGTRLESTGTAPLLMEPVQAAVKLTGAAPTKIVPCDHYGTPIAGASVPVEKDGTFHLHGGYRAYYYEVKR